MQSIHAKKIASSTDMRQPNKVLEEAGGETVAITNRNHIIGYFVPAEKVDLDDVREASDAEVADVLEARHPIMSDVNRYLQDK